MIGEKIRELRKSRSISMSELAARVGVTDSYISQLERNVADPSVSVLRRISAALNVPIATFFDENYEEPALIRRGEYRKCPSPMDGLNLEGLTPVPSEWNNRMELFQFTLQPKKLGEILQHSGETCIYVTKGSLEISLENASYSLKKGDSIYVNANVPYQLRNTATTTAAGILCSTGSMRKETSR